MPDGAYRFNLTGKVALVAGGAGYLGTAVCRALAEHGAHVVVADINGDSADATAALIAADGFSVEAMQMNIADEPSVTRSVKNTAARSGGLDIVVNATAWSTGKPAEQMGMADWEKGLRVSLSGAFVLSRESGRIMTAGGGGSIIHFSSMYGKISPDPRIYAPAFNVNPVDYGAAKAGLLQMVRYLAVLWGPRGVRVNAVVPGPFPNPAGQGGNAGFVKKLSDKVPLGRVGKAEEIVGAVIFLASSAASFVTAAEIVVDGGWTAW